MAVVDFEAFKEACIERGYTRILEENNNCVVYSQNGVKSEIKTKLYTFGWLRSPDELTMIRDAFRAAGYDPSDKQQVVNIAIDKNKDMLEVFLDLLEIVESIETITVKERGSATKVFSKEVDEENKFLKIVKRYSNAIENEDQELLDMARSLLSSDSIDRMIVRGQSEQYVPEHAYREHAVPCILIHNEIIRMVLDDQPVHKITQMIISNLAIVLIHEDEARYMDVDLGLRTSMPEGWKFGDSIFARFETASIKLK